MSEPPIIPPIIELAGACRALLVAGRQALTWCEDCGGDAYYYQRDQKVGCGTCSALRAAIGQAKTALKEN